MGNNSNDDEIIGYSSKQTNVDPETKSISWDITYKANYGLIYKTFRTLIRDFKKFVVDDEIKKDPKFKEIEESLNTIWNKFRSHLRHNYPKQYNKLQALKEEEIKELIKKTLGEINVTGAGSNAAHIESGEGIGYATKYAFKNKKQLKEETSEEYLNKLNLKDPSLKTFINDKIKEFDQIEDKLNILVQLLKTAKEKTKEHYKVSPDFEIQYGTDLAVDYLDDIITLFRDKK